MGRKRKYSTPDGQEFEGTSVPFRSGVEHWNEYLLDDGTVIRVKLVATEIIRLDGQFDAMGNPSYAVFSANVTHVSAPDELKEGGS